MEFFVYCFESLADIRAVLNFSFFYEKIPLAQKAQKALKALKCTKSTKSTKITKRYKDTQVKEQNANERISDYFPLRCFLDTFLFSFSCKRFVLFCGCEIFE